jgi:hypothetical protein
LKTVTILTGTNVKNGKKLLNREFDGISWWSNNYETLAHYYEGCAIEMIVKVNPKVKQEYIREVQDLTTPVSEYTYGFIRVLYPKGAIWYSFGASYLKDNVISIKEIFPNLEAYNE